MNVKEEFIEEYKKALKKRNKILAYNQKIKKKVRTTHTLFALFFLYLAYVSINPQYVEGIQGDALESQVQAEYLHLVATGWNDIRDIQLYLQEYRENKQHSYLVLGNTVYRTHEIPELLLHSKWGVLVKPLLDIATLVSVFFQRGYASISSLFLLLKDSGNGTIHIQQLGDVAASGIWVFLLHLWYGAFLWFRNTLLYCKEENMEEYQGYPILVRGEEGTHVVMYYDMIDIINHPPKQIEPPIAYAWIYERLGIE